MKMPSWLKKTPAPAPAEPVKPIHRATIGAVHPSTKTEFTMTLSPWDFPTSGDLDLLLRAVVDGLRSHDFKVTATIQYEGEQVRV